MVMTGVKSNLNDKLNRLLKIFPVVMLVGARQTEKTTLAQTSRPNWEAIVFAYQ